MGLQDRAAHVGLTGEAQPGLAQVQQRLGVLGIRLHVLELLLEGAQGARQAGDALHQQGEGLLPRGGGGGHLFLQGGDRGALLGRGRLEGDGMLGQACAPGDVLQGGAALAAQLLRQGRAVSQVSSRRARAASSRSEKKPPQRARTRARAPRRRRLRGSRGATARWVAMAVRRAEPA
ncbi:MAG: hypothetical protein ABIO70_31595, partial [Pseudomonadota bacterium]